MRAVELAGAVADPQHMRRAIVPIAGGAIDAGQRLLVLQDQRLVGGEEIGLADLRRGLGSQSAGFHEMQRLADAVGQIAIALALRAARHETERPAMHLMQIRIAALGEGAQQVERRRRLIVGLDQPLRIGIARFRSEFHAVDDVAAIGWAASPRSGFRSAPSAAWRIGRPCGRPSPPGMPRKSEHHRHLQHHAEGVADVIGMEFGEAFGAIAALQQERLALGTTSASSDLRRRASPAKTSGGKRFSLASTLASAA